MPELPEVETTIKDLNRNIINLKIIDIWADRKNIVRSPSFKEFSKKIKGRKIIKIRRRAKYILIDLDNNQTIIIHQKLSGHLLYGKWQVKNNKVKSLIPGPLSDDPQNKFIRLILYLNNKRSLALSDLRRFAKIILCDTDKVEELKEIKELGPEPLDKNFTFEKFKEVLKNKKGRIKSVLMDQKTIAGIGNIYSDEILWYAKIHPLKKVEELNERELKELYRSIKKVLLLAIKSYGDSFQDYRRPSGELGFYQYKQKVYQRTGQKCFRNDGGIIQRIKIGGRSAHFCPVCQKH